jgi:hypothetical protein|tara:strand:+ start:129 stop:422 length:294 start_codon:yes stop_codon:yes gene_type:complete
MISKKNILALKNQLEKHNKSVRSTTKKMTLPKLKKSFKRGTGAYFTNPELRRSRNITSSDQWALGRTQELLKAIKTEKFKNKPYDLDLIPKGNKLKK